MPHRQPKRYRPPGLSPARAATIKHLIEQHVARTGTEPTDVELAAMLAVSPKRIAIYRDQLAKGRRP